MSLWRLALFCVVLSGCSGRGSSSLPLTPSEHPAAIASVSEERTTASSDAPEWAAAKLKVVYSFKTSGDGAQPEAALLNVNGELYGTTTGGGAYGYGTVFEASTSGSEHVLHSFAAGATPLGALIAVNGTLYSTQEAGGSHNCGTVFEITPAGSEHTLYSFKCSPDGADPYAGLIDVDGELYGTTLNDGAAGDGTVFAVSTAGKERVVTSFGGSNGVNGAAPDGSLINVNGVLYGTTSDGGDAQDTGGTVFEVGTSGKEHVLHNFGSILNDGDSPRAGLIDVNGTLYGTTTFGGASGNGTVFELSTSGATKVLYSFKGGADGALPEASLLNINGTLYGTTVNGGGSNFCGPNGCGTIFAISLAGKERVVHVFSGSDGALPEASLIEVNGTLYGTTSEGGANGVGSIFKLTP